MADRPCTRRARLRPATPLHPPRVVSGSCRGAAPRPASAAGTGAQSHPLAARFACTLGSATARTPGSSVRPTRSVAKPAPGRSAARRSAREPKSAPAWRPGPQTSATPRRGPPTEDRRSGRRHVLPPIPSAPPIGGGPESRAPSPRNGGRPADRSPSATSRRRRDCHRRIDRPRTA